MTKKPHYLHFSALQNIMNLNLSSWNLGSVNKSKSCFVQNFSVSILTKASTHNSSLPFFNRNFDKKQLKLLFSWYYANRGENAAFSLVETLQKLGFSHAMKAGISLGIDDLQVPPTKKKSITEAVELLNTTKNSVYSGDVMALEEFQQFVDIWHRTSEQLKTSVVQNFTKSSFNSLQRQYYTHPFQKFNFHRPVNKEPSFTSFGNTLNPVYMMAFSGARGNLSQVRQLVGMRGLMADPQGQLVEFPIQSNFREGLTVTEYMISCYGARKGLVDTALRTAAAGYLTRRLVDVAHHQIVRSVTCGTKGGIWLSTEINNKIQQSQDVILPSTWKVPPFLASASKAELHLSLKSKQSDDKNQPKKSYSNFQKRGLLGQEASKEEGNAESKNPFIFTKHPAITRCIGRVLARDIPGIAFRNQEIDISLGSLPLLRRIYETVGIYVRSPLTCKMETGICQLCYGWSVSANRLVGLGEAVGIVAAQSIGEPGTQLTMRTFHTGGVFSGDIMEECRAKHGGVVSFQGPSLGLMVRTAGGAIGFCIKTPGTLTISSKDDLTTYQLSANSLLFVRQGENVLMNSLLAQIPNLPEIEENTGESTKTIYSGFSGEIRQTPTINEALENIRILAGQQNLPIYLSHKETCSYLGSGNRERNNQQLIESYQVVKSRTLKNQNSKIINFANLREINPYLNSLSGLYPKNTCTLFMQPGVHRLGQRFTKSKKFFSNFKYHSAPLKRESIIESLQTIDAPQGQINLINNSKLLKNHLGATKKPQMAYTPVSHKFEKAREITVFHRKFGCLSSEIKSLLKKGELLKNKPDRSKIITKFLPYLLIENKSILNLNDKSIHFKSFHKIFETLYQPASSSLLAVSNTLIKTSEPVIKTKFNSTHFIEPVLFNDFSRENRTIPLITNPLNNILISNKLLGLDLITVLNFFKFIKLKNYAYLFWTKWSIIFFKCSTTFFVFDIVTNKKSKKKLSVSSKQTTSPFSQLQITLNRQHKVFNVSYSISKGSKFSVVNGKGLILKNGGLSRERVLLRSNKQQNLAITSGMSDLTQQEVLTSKQSKSLYNGMISKKTSVRKCKSTSSISICNYLQTNITCFLAQKMKGSKYPLLNSLRLQRPVAYVSTNRNEKQPFLKSGEIFPIQGHKNIQDFLKAYHSQTGTLQSTGLLTDSDRISYKLLQEPFNQEADQHNRKQDLNFPIGAFVNTGDELVKNYGSTTCGQVIEKSFSAVTLRFTQNILYSNLKFRPAIVSPKVKNGSWLPKGTPLVKLPYISSVTGDIVAGIPKIEQLFEARGEALQEIVDKIWHSYKSLIVPKSKAVRDCFKEIGLFLVGAIQKVYSSQGVHIADKHLEVVISQMTKRVLITDPGDTEFLRDEFVDMNTIESVNWTTYGEIASYRPHLIGITKMSLNSTSFLSSASFQQTARVLERETFLEKTDRLLGLKERVMMGAVINAGTGGYRTDVFLAKVRKKSLSGNLFKNLSFFSRRVIEQNRENY